MKAKDIQELIDFIAKSGLNEVNVETNDFKISVTRDAEKELIAAAPQIMAAAPAISAAPIASAPAAPIATPAATPEASSNLIEVKSPIIGTFYRRANPESPNFVEVGDSVSEGQVVCIVEAMKLFNEIESEISGKVVKVLVDDSSPIEYDQPLFLVDPS